MWRFKVLSVPLDFSDANFCPLNSGPLDLNRLKIIDDILNRLKCPNVKCQKYITEEPINFISIIAYNVLLKCARKQMVIVGSV